VSSSARADKRPEARGAPIGRLLALQPLNTALLAPPEAPGREPAERILGVCQALARGHGSVEQLASVAVLDAGRGVRGDRMVRQ
jgi:hypothetical protein